jgi:type IX secretion system PorP/SprF family membrane protein
MRKIILYIFLSSLPFAKGLAQDIHFSQYMYSPLNLSPASTGLFDGDIRANAFYRRQWNAVTVPYKTFGLAYDQVLGNSAASGSRNSGGVLINNDRAGDGNFGSLQLLLSFARLFSLGRDSVHFINAGIQSGFIYRSINVNELTFDNQYNGDVFDPNFATNESFDRTDYIYPDLNLGLAWLGLFSNTTAQAGFSIQHLNKPNQTFLNQKNTLPLRFQLNAGAWLKQYDRVSFFPSVLWMSQQEFRELTFGAEVKLNTQKNTLRKNAISLAVHYRTDDAIIPALGIYYDLWRFGFSYDINTSDLKRASNRRGGPEINVTYIMKKIRYKEGKNICPVY